MATIVLNGKRHDLEIGSTVADLLDGLSIARGGLAVAVNDQIVPHGNHDGHALNDGDRVEIISAIGGG